MRAKITAEVRQLVEDIAADMRRGIGREDPEQRRRVAWLVRRRGHGTVEEAWSVIERAAALVAPKE